MTRLEKVPLWGAVGLIWLITLVILAGFAEQILAFLIGIHPLSGTPISACDLPNFCLNGESAVPMSWVSPSSVAWTIATDVALILTLVAALGVGTGVIRRISAGRAFAADTVTRMALTAGVLLGGGILSYVFAKIAFSHIESDSLAFQEAGNPDGMTVIAGYTPDLPGALIFAGILAFALWAAFRQGTRIQQELDYVV